MRLINMLPRQTEWLLLLIVLGAIWIGSSIPPSEFPEARIFDFDKVLHGLEYLVLGLSIGLILLRRPQLIGSETWRLWILLPGLVWAVTDELHQAVVGRDCSTGDLLADLAGLTLATFLVGLLRKRETTGGSVR